MNSVDDYVAAIADVQQREAIEQVRATGKSILPKADEALSYAMPTFKENGASLIAYAPTKKHIGLYPCSSLTVPAFLKAFPDIATTKGAVQLPYGDKRLKSVMKEIIRLRREEVASGTHR